MKESKIGVHRRHCCIKHGCKYGDDNCPVVKGEVKQDGPCWVCYVEEGYEPKPGPDKSVKPPDIEWVDNSTTHRLVGPKNITIKEDFEKKEFLKGFIWASLIIILLHIGLAYAIFI